MTFLLPDPNALRAVADRIQLQAVATRGRAERLRARAQALDWRGVAAGAFDGEARLALRGLVSAADRLDAAADALRRHADLVGSLLGAISRLCAEGLDAEQAALRVAGGLVSDGVHAVGNAVGRALHLVGL
jgi:uncharacterized protein YukE